MNTEEQAIQAYLDDQKKQRENKIAEMKKAYTSLLLKFPDLKMDAERGVFTIANREFTYGHDVPFFPNHHNSDYSYFLIYKKASTFIGANIRSMVDLGKLIFEERKEAEIERGLRYGGTGEVRDKSGKVIAIRG